MQETRVFLSNLLKRIAGIPWGTDAADNPASHSLARRRPSWRGSGDANANKRGSGEHHRPIPKTGNVKEGIVSLLCGLREYAYDAPP